MPVIRCDIGEQVKPDGKFNVARIEIYQVVGTLRRNVMQQLLGQVAVRVNQSDAMTKLDVLQNEIAEQRRLSRTRFPDDVYVLPLVAGRYAKRHRFSVAISVSDHNVWFVRFQNQSPPPSPRAVRLNAGRML